MVLAQKQKHRSMEQDRKKEVRRVRVKVAEMEDRPRIILILSKSLKNKIVEQN